jgi:O-antigen/teichoic acid export membrane protein
MVIITVVRFFSVPLFLWAWTPELYGEWLILYSLVGYFSLGNLGFAQAAANEMTMFVARGEHDRALVTYQSTFVIISFIAVGLVGLAAIVGWLLPLERWMGLAFIGGAGLRLIVLLFVGYVVVGFLVGLFMAGYRCEGRYHRGLVFQNVALLIEFGALAAVLLVGWGPISAAVSMVVVRVVAVLAMLVDLKLVLPWLRLGATRAQRAELRRILAPSLSFAAFPAGNTLINQGIILGIGATVGPVAVVLWSSLRTLTNLVTRVFDLVNQAFYPEVSIAWGAGDRVLVRRLHRVSCQASLWLGLCAVAGLAVLGPWVFGKWTQGKLELDMPLFWGFLGLVWLRSLWYTSFVVPSAINQHQRLTVVYLIASALGLGASLVSLGHGLVFAVAGFAAVEVAMVVVVLPRSLRLAEDRPGGFLSAALPPPNPAALWSQVRPKRAVGR